MRKVTEGITQLGTAVRICFTTCSITKYISYKVEDNRKITQLQEKITVSIVGFFCWHNIIYIYRFFI